MQQWRRSSGARPVAPDQWRRTSGAGLWTPRGVVDGVLPSARSERVLAVDALSQERISVVKKCHFAVAAALLSVACGGDDIVTLTPPVPEAPPAEGGSPPAGAEQEPAYVLMHTISSPEGRLNYVVASPTLEIGEFDRLTALEVSGASRTFALGGAAFVADAETLSIRRFEVADDYQLVQNGSVSFANYGITYFDTGFTLIDEQRAWYMASDALEVIQFNPKTMDITGTVDLGMLGHPTLTTYVDGGKQVGDYVFAAVWYYTDDDSTVYVPGIKVAVISTSEMRVVKVIEDPRCAMGAVAAKLENDDLLVYGDASTGALNVFGQPPAPANCVLRIKAGETDFDPTFFQVLDDITLPSVAGSRFAYDAGKALVWARDPDEFATLDDYYMATRWTPFLIDPELWNAERIDDPALVANGFPADTFFIDGAPHFTVARTDGQTGGALVRYSEGVLTQEVLYSEWLQAVAKVR